MSSDYFRVFPRLQKYVYRTVAKSRVIFVEKHLFCFAAEE